MRAGGRSLALGDVCWRQIASISPPCPQVDCNAYYFHLIKTYLAGPRREENHRAFVLPRSPVGRSVPRRDVFASSPFVRCVVTRDDASLLRQQLASRGTVPYVAMVQASEESCRLRLSSEVQQLKIVILSRSIWRLWSRINTLLHQS